MVAKSLVDLLVYAAALDAYRKHNTGARVLRNGEIAAVLDLADWSRRPAILSEVSQ